MATLKAGTYRLKKDVTIPPNSINQAINFVSFGTLGNGKTVTEFYHISVYSYGGILYYFRTNDSNGVISVKDSGGWEETASQLFTTTQDQDVSQEFFDWVTENNIKTKFTRLYIGDTVASVGSKCFKRLTTEEPVLAAGLYDADDNLVASWDTLVNTYGMDCEKDYTSSSYASDTASPYYVLTNTAELANGVKLIIDNSVTRIGNRSFYNYQILTSITIPNSVTSIGESAFYSLKALTNINIPDSVTSIGSKAFLNCTALQKIYLPSIEKWCSIERNSHCLCQYATEIYFANELCGSSLTIPDSVTHIGNYAFSYFYVTSITIPDSVTHIGIRAFDSCRSLTSITIPDSVVNIDVRAFNECVSLENIKIGNSVTSIAIAAFEICKALTSITIPNSVTSIGNGAFRSCTSLTRVNFNGTMAEWNARAFNTIQIFRHGSIYMSGVDTPASYVTCSDGTVAI